MKTFIRESIDEDLESLPREPGVYLLKNEEGRTVYVGKSSNIGNRVRSHLSPSRGSGPAAKINQIDYIVTGSELEALTLECSLIKRLRPVHNTRLKDDKSYPYIKITIGDEYPGVYVTRTYAADGSVYLGPYADVGSARRTIKTLRDVFPIRRCRRKMQKTSKPCLDYHIKKCSGPCRGDVNPDRYAEDVKGLLQTLEGRRLEILRSLKASMVSAASSQQYERAAVLRDRLDALEKTTLRQRLSSAGPGDADVLGSSVKDEYACIQILFVRDGVIIGDEHYVLEGAGGSRMEILSSFVKQYYSNNPVPPNILASIILDDRDLISSWLAERSERTVKIVEPADTDLKSLTAMADRNAEMVLDLEIRKMGDSVKRGLQELAHALDLAYLPKLIEAYDISNTSGRQAVGSMVRFRWGRPSRSLYRKFRIRAPGGRDDYAMMREVIGRRFAGALHREGLPDLVLVDGGPGQASAARDALLGLNLDIPVVGLAKGEEKVYRPGSRLSVRLGRRSEGGKILQAIRNEAHRFAISYHRGWRQRAVIRSELDSVCGIGPKRKAALMREFGSVDRISRASRGELARIPGITDSMARNILDHLRGRRRARVD